MEYKSKLSKRIFFIFLILNIVAIPVLSGIFFPNNKGFTRNVIFLHPTNSTRGYYIIIDEIHTKKSIQFMFHSRGSLIIGETSTSWTQGDIRMNCTFFGSTVQITPKENFLYAGTEKERNHYIQVQPTKGSQFLITVINFVNLSSFSPFELSSTVSDRKFILSINSTDRFVLNENVLSHDLQSWNYENYYTDAKFFLVRDSPEPDNNFIVTSPISMFKKENGTVYNGNLNPIVISNETVFDGFCEGFNSEIEYSTPLNICNFSSPGLYFTEHELLDLRDKINQNGSQWKIWYDKIDTKSPLSLAFRGRIEENSSYISQCENLLLNLETYYETELKYRQDIDQSVDLTENILAFDMIYNNITTQNQNTIRQVIYNTVEPLYNHHKKNVEYLNNHLIVSSVAIGLAGILLNIPEWVRETQRSIDFYLNGYGIRPNGACYEGAHYAYFEFKHASKFFYALQHVGGYNYFTNPRYQAFLNYSVLSMAPTGESPVFEDCQVNRTLNIIASLSMSNVQDSNPILAQNLKFLYNRTESFPYEYITQIILNADVNTITQSPPEMSGRNNGFIYPSDGYACFRSGWKVDDYYLILSNKNFLQSHVHEDENSFELYAYGKKWMTNPGYPSWGWEGHSYTISAEASNTAVINEKGQFSYLGDGFASGVQHALVDYVESPTNITYKHPAYFWAWSGFLAMYLMLIINSVGLLIVKSHPIPPEVLSRSQMSKKMKFLPLIQAIIQSLIICIIFTPILIRSYFTLAAHTTLSSGVLLLILVVSNLSLAGIPIWAYYKWYRTKTMNYKERLSEILFGILKILIFGIFITPKLIMGYNQIIYESGSTLIITSRLVLLVSRIIPLILVVIGIVALSIYVRKKIKRDLDVRLRIQNMIQRQIWFWSISMYLLMIALVLLNYW